MTTNGAGSRKPEKATIRNLEDNKEFEVMFNPAEYSLSKSNTWTQVSIRESNVPRTYFSGGDPTELTVELFFDTYERGEDVRDYTQKVINLTKVSEHNDGFRPPRCMFSWGKVFNFPSVITRLSYKYTMFREDGTAVRASMNLTFREAADASAKQGQESPPYGIPGHKVFIVKPGDTIDSIAAREYGDPKTWRFIADNNNLDDPKDLRPGQILIIEELAT